MPAAPGGIAAVDRAAVGTAAATPLASSSGTALPSLPLADSSDDVLHVVSMYANLGSLPKAGYVKQLSMITQALDDRAQLGRISMADDTAPLLMHLVQLEEILQAYLATSTYALANPSASAASSSASASTSGTVSGSLDGPAVPSLLFHSAEFTAFFLDTALPGIVRNLLMRSYSSGLGSGLLNTRARSIAAANAQANAAAAAAAAPSDGSEQLIPRVNQFFQLVLRVIVKHMKEPTKPVAILLPAPPAPASAAAAAPPAATPPAFVTTTVNPLFPDSMSSNLLQTLMRICSKDKQFYYFHDYWKAPGAPSFASVAAAPALPGSDDEEDEEEEVEDETAADEVHETELARVRGLDPVALLNSQGLTVDQLVQKTQSAHKAAAKTRQKKRLAKAEARKAAQKKKDAAAAAKAAAPVVVVDAAPAVAAVAAAPAPPAVQYCSSTPGSPAYGFFQSNVQYFGEIGGFELLVTRMAVGVNARIDSRVPVPSRRGYNPAQGANSAFYSKEHARRMAWREHQESEAEAAGIILAPDTDPAVKGSFPSIAPYLTPASFMPSHPTTLAKVPLHRVKLLLDPLLHLVSTQAVHRTFIADMGSRVKDLLIIRLLHIGPDESRLCDKEFLLNLLQEYVWKFIHQLRGNFTGNWDQVKWPILDEESSRKLKELTKAEVEQSVAAAAAIEAGEAAGSIAAAAHKLAGPPPLLYEMNLNPDELMECLTIYLSYQLFSSSLLEKRINGLADINRMVDLTVTRDRLDRTNTSASAGGVRIAVTAWMSMQVLSDYLLEIGILDDLFGEYNPEGSPNGSSASAPPPTTTPKSDVIGANNKDKSTHPQLIQRCDEMLRYFARLGKLTPRHLRQVWAASIDKHESIQLAVYALLAAVVRMLRFEHVVLLLTECVAAVPYTDWSGHTLKLLGDLARGPADPPPPPPSAVAALVPPPAPTPQEEERMKQQEQVVRTACAILWSLLTLPHETASSSSSSVTVIKSPSPSNSPSNARVNVPFHLKQAAASLMQSLLSKSWLEPLRREYIMRIIEAIKTRSPLPAAAARDQAPAPAVATAASTSTKSIGMLLWLLPGLLFCYNTGRTEPDALQRWRFIHNLNEREKLTALILGDLASYVSQARAALPAAMDALNKRLGSSANRQQSRRTPDASLLVLTGDSGEEPGGLGISLADLDASVTLPASLETSTELMDALRFAAKDPSSSSATPTPATTGTVVPGATSARASAAAAGGSSMLYSEQLSHELEVLLRLEMLRFLLVHSYSALSDRHVESLFGSLAPPQALSSRSADLWHTWLRTLHQPRPTATPLWIQTASHAHALLKLNWSFSDNTKYSSAFSDTHAREMFINRLCVAPVKASKSSAVVVAAADGAAPAAGDWAQMDEAAFTCWRHYFTVCNEAARLIELHAPLSSAAYNLYCQYSGEGAAACPPVPKGSTPPVKFGLVCSAPKPLYGLEQLWAIALHAQQPAVVALAAELLIQVHACDSAAEKVAQAAAEAAQALSASSSASASGADVVGEAASAVAGVAALAASISSAQLEADAEWKYQMREKFIARCMESMKGDDAGAGAGADSARTLRCLNLLHQFMEACQQPDGGAESEKDAVEGGDASVSAGPFVLLVRLGPFGSTSGSAAGGGQDDVVKVEVTSEAMTVRQLKEQLSRMVSAPVSKMGLVLTAAANTTAGGGAPLRELLNYETLSARMLAPTSGVPTVSLRMPTNQSNINHPGNDARMPGEDDVADAGAAAIGDEDDETGEAAALQLARNFTPATTSLPSSGGVGASMIGQVGANLPQTPSSVAGGSSAAQQAAAAAAAQAASRQPMQLLANRQEYFDTLFSLLQSGGSGTKGAGADAQQEISQRVWKLITSLPTNERLMDEMRRMVGVTESNTSSAVALAGGNATADIASSPWSKLLDPQSPFKLLYSLRIISKLASAHLPVAVAGAGAASAASTKAYLAGVEWRNQFLRLGGVEYLYAILGLFMNQRAAALAASTTQGAPAVEWDESRNACLALLLKLFTFFLLCAQSHSNRAILYLLPEVLSDLPSAGAAAVAASSSVSSLPEVQLVALMRGLSNNVDFLRVVHFPALAQNCLKLMAACAKSAAKSFRHSGGNNAATTATTTAAALATHTRAGSISNAPTRSNSLVVPSSATPARVRPSSTSSAATSAEDAAADQLASLDDLLIKQCTLLLSACVLHEGGEVEQAASSAAGSDSASANSTALAVLMSTPTLPTLFSTLFFLVPLSISQEQGDAWFQLAEHFRAQQTQALSAVAAGDASAPLAGPISPMSLHRFLFVDILLKILPPVCTKVQYASHAQDFFQLLVFLARELLRHDLEAARLGMGHQQVMGSFDWVSLAQRTVSWMKARPVLESKHAVSGGGGGGARGSGAANKAIECDHVFVGLMNLLSSLVQLMPSLKDLVAARPAYSLEAEELLLSESAATGGRRASRGEQQPPAAATPADLNPAAGLIREVFLYLFDLPSMRSSSSTLLQAPKAKRRITRLAAFHLLLTLVENHKTNYARLAGLLLEQNQRDNSVALSNEWEYMPEDYIKSNTGYVGMQNLGATCYISSLMQQLWMVPGFRAKLLSVHTTAGPNSAQTRSGSPSAKMLTSSAPATGAAGGGAGAPPDGTDNVLYQMQLMFGSLQESEKKAFNPVNFCKSYKDWDGNSVNLRLQMDVDEFYNGLCDKLEQALKDNVKEIEASGGGAAAAAASSGGAGLDIVRETFGGTLEHQLLCLDCPHTSSRTEPFFALPLGVKNKPSVAASLEQFITGEMLEGDNCYMCQICKKKVRALKRVLVKSLPEVLVLCLKRFDFDYNSMVKSKLNDCVSFPHAEPLQMQPYTVEGVAKKEAEKKKGAQAAAEAAASSAADGGEESKESDASSLPAASPPLASLVSGSGAGGAAQATSYTLVGVLLHSGGSESGHYTSLVKERLSNGVQTGRWLEFNDSVVKEFDPALIPTEAFGGSNTVTAYDLKLRRKVTREVEKTRSAYLLIYARNNESAIATATAAMNAMAASSGTPIGSPLKRAASTTASATTGGPDSPKFAPSGGASPQRFSASGRAKTPLLDLGPTAVGGSNNSLRSPTSPPPIMQSVRRSNSGPGLNNLRGAGGGGRKLEFAGDEDFDDAAPSATPAFSRFASFESKQPETSSSSSSFSSSPSSPMHGATSSHKRSGSAAGGAAGAPAPVVGSMPPQILERIWEENLTFLRNKQLFHPDYFKFMLSFLQLAPMPLDSDEIAKEYGAPAELDCEDDVRHIQLACTYLTDVLAHAKFITNPAAFAKDMAARTQGDDEEDRVGAGASQGLKLRAIGGRLGAEQRARMQIDAAAGAAAPHTLLPAYRSMLQNFFATHLPACVWFVGEYVLGSRYRLRFFLFECGNELMRDALAELCISVLRLLVPDDRAMYEITDMIEYATPAAAATSPAGAAAAPVQSYPQPRSMVLRFIDHVMSLWKDLAWHWRCLGSYFSILHAFAQFGHNERVYLLQSHSLVYQIVDFYLCNASPLASHDKYKRPLLGDQDTQPNFFAMFGLLSALVRTTLMQTQLLNDPESPQTMPPGLLSVTHGTIPLPEETPELLQVIRMTNRNRARLARRAARRAARAQAGEQMDEDGFPIVESPPSEAELEEAAAGHGEEDGDADEDSPTNEEQGAEGGNRGSWVVQYAPPASQCPPSFEYLALHSYVLHQNELELLFNETFLKKLLRESFNMEANREIICHLVWNAPRTEPYIAKIFLKCIDEANYDRLDPLLSLLPALLGLQDTLQSERLERYLSPRTGLISKADYHSVRYPLFTYVMVKFLILDLGRMEGHPAREYLIRHRDSLYWCLNWILEHHNRSQARALKPSLIGGMMVGGVSAADAARQTAIQTSVADAIADWFGAEYITAREEEDARKLAEQIERHEAAKKAQADRVAAAAAAFHNPAAPADGGNGEGEDGEEDGDRDADDGGDETDPLRVASGVRGGGGAGQSTAVRHSRVARGDDDEEEQRHNFGDTSADDDGDGVDDDTRTMSDFSDDERGQMSYQRSSLQVSGTRLQGGSGSNNLSMPPLLPARNVPLGPGGQVGVPLGNLVIGVDHREGGGGGGGGGTVHTRHNSSLAVDEGTESDIDQWRTVRHRRLDDDDDDADEDLQSYFPDPDADDDPVEAVRRFEEAEAQRKANGGK